MIHVAVDFWAYSGWEKKSWWGFQTIFENSEKIAGCFFGVNWLQFGSPY